MDVTDRNDKVCPVCKEIYIGNRDHHMRRKCHGRVYCCKECGEKGTYKSITGGHVNECGSIKIQCKLCSQYRERGTMDEHVNNYCRHGKMHCPVCGEIVKKKDINEHLKSDIPPHRMAIDKKCSKASSVSNCAISTQTGAEDAPAIDKSEISTCKLESSRLTSSATNDAHETSADNDDLALTLTIQEILEIDTT